MTKGFITIRTNEGFKNVEGYITADGKHGLIKHGNAWNITDIPTGIALSGAMFKTRKAAIEDIARAEKVITERGLRDTEQYKKAVKELSNHKGIKESEVKKMAKTNTESKVKRNNYKKQNEELKKEIEILKKQIEEMGKVEKTNIDTFNIEDYMASRDNLHRITPELIEALENTKGLRIEFRNSNKEVVPFSGTEWLYVFGETEADTKERKDMFKAMSFKFSAEKAWVLAPYPIRSKKAWGAKKARKAMATA